MTQNGLKLTWPLVLPPEVCDEGGRKVILTENTEEEEAAPLRGKGMKIYN